MVYENGLYFSTSLALKGLDPLIERMENNKAVMIIIDGGLGEGKTTLLIHILDYINHKYGKPPIDLNGCQFATGGIDFTRKMRLCYEKGFHCIGYDEAGDFSRRGSLTQFNAIMNRTFETFRAFKCIVVLTLPNFEVLDNNLFHNQIPRLLLHLRNRTKGWGNYYGYNHYRMSLAKAKMKNLPIKSYAFTIIKSNIRGHFLNLDPKTSAELERISTTGKMDILRRGETKLGGVVSYVDIAEKYGKNKRTVRNLMKKYKIKPFETIKGQNFYDRSSLGKLIEHFEHPKKTGKKT